LAAQIDALFADTAALQPGTRYGLSDAEVARLRACAPQYRALCAELAGYGLPETLEHGDFWPGNIIATAQSCVYFDWSDASITHLFFRLRLSRETAGAHRPAIPDARTRLRDAYLEPWSLYAPMRRLVRAFDLAQRLAPLHHALTYHRYILPHIEAKWEAEAAL